MDSSVVVSDAALSNARKEVRQVRNASRRADRALAELETFGSVTHGSYLVGVGEKLDREELVDFVRLAQDSNPSSAIEVIVIARAPGTENKE